MTLIIFRTFKKIKIIFSFVKFVALKRGKDTTFFPLLFSVVIDGIDAIQIRDPGLEKIWIWDPQRWCNCRYFLGLDS